jgi:uncharacterized membrane protein SpoIIM required for sporulation
MTPLHFEQRYEGEWTELAMHLAALTGRQRGGPVLRDGPSSARAAALYRRACEHLALARARSYPAYLVDRLEHLTAEGHQLIYHQPEFGLGQLRRLFEDEFPSAVRRQRRYVAIAAATFLLPTLALGVLVYLRPEMILTLISSDRAAEFEQMYSRSAESIGRERTASTDWMMFGFYIRNNIGVAFQCFAGGLIAGVGSLFFLAYNGAFSGALAGFLTGHGLSSTFYPFIATHSAFELTAIVLAGAAGLRLGHALLAPGRATRRQSLLAAARACVVLIYGATGMLLIAAVIEAFWSSATWLPSWIKLSVAAVCWATVITYFTRQGRRRAD